MGIRSFLHNIFPVKPTIWVGDVGRDPPYGADPGGNPPPGGKVANRKAPKAPDIQGLVLPPIVEYMWDTLIE